MLRLPLRVRCGYSHWASAHSLAFELCSLCGIKREPYVLVAHASIARPRAEEPAYVYDYTRANRLHHHHAQLRSHLRSVSLSQARAQQCCPHVAVVLQLSLYYQARTLYVSGAFCDISSRLLRDCTETLWLFRRHRRAPKCGSADLRLGLCRDISTTI